MAIGGIAIALLTGWLNRCLGGHTGYTYDTVVEWTEALLLCMIGYYRIRSSLDLILNFKYFTRYS
ncbi:hypothetical protein ACP6PL_04565 [Dapis sp. BLCC M126]|uniref:hypothetical protein n=1 Tax=Dapis sp. BLCC M126 TaxID=3400189 RepID=UPI003CEABD0A